MKLVKENIDFRRGRKSKSALSIGMDSPEARKRRMRTLEKRIHHIRPDALSIVVENIDAYENALENLENKGINIGKIGIVIGEGKFNIPTWRVIQGNQVLHMSVSEEDAQSLSASIAKYDVDKDPQYAYIEEENGGAYMSIQDLKDFWKRRGWKWQS